MELNRKALLAVRKKILAVPASFDMSDFSRSRFGKNAPPCGTVACIAGWTIIHEAERIGLLTQAKHIDGKKLTALSYGLKLSDTDHFNPASVARKILGITASQAERLFFTSYWPDPYLFEYDQNEQLFEDGAIKEKEFLIRNAKTAARRLMYFLKTGK